MKAHFKYILRTMWMDFLILGQILPVEIPTYNRNICLKICVYAVWMYSCLYAKGLVWMTNISF